MPRIPASVLRIVFPASPLLLLVLLSPVVQSADVNGYTAEYECRAGGPRCDVDVAQYASRACDQTVQAGGGNWPIMNWNTDTNGDGHVVICIAAGDHTAKGTLTLPSNADGSASNYKVLRYHRSGDSNDEPWQQSSANQAKLWQLKVQGSHWIIHRLTFPQGTGPSPKVQSGAGSSGHIFNRILVEGSGTSSNTSVYGYSQDCNVSGYSNLTVQNSVFRNSGGQNLKEGIALDMQCASNLHAINNEIYDWCSHAIQTGHNGHPTLSGLVIENNDLYITPTMHTGDGRSKTEGPLDTKAHGTSSSPAMVLHNRFWGARRTDTSFCGNGGDGAAIVVNSDTDWQLYQNNIMLESTAMVYFGTNTPSPDRGSFVGNIGYQLNKYFPSAGASAGIKFDGAASTEAYSNTVIQATKAAMELGGTGNNGDLRCNVFIDSAASSGSTSGTVVDHNVFYGTPSYSLGGTDTNVIKTLETRANATPYVLNQIIRTSATPTTACVVGTESACFLYKVIQAGTSASSPPSYCTTLGCTTNDGSVVVQAIRGPYEFRRKLRTVAGGEKVVIPYGTVHIDADEASFCPGEGQANAVGSRIGIGINDDVAWNGILDADLEATLRAGTAGALQTESDTPPPPGDGSGTILREHWAGIAGVFVADLTSHPDYPDNPTGSDQLTLFEAPVNWADNYGTQIRGYVHPPVNGTYTFWIASDDSSELWLSTNENPANKVLIASQDGGFTNPREWTKHASQQSAAISLNAGQKYYIEALQKEGTGGDNLAVGWQLPDGTLERPIGGNRLSPFVPASSPFPGPDPAAVPGLIEAENFDNGGEGVSYHDVDVGNNADGGAYRTSDVDIKVDQGASNGHAVGWVRTGEWVKYTVNVASAGEYTLEVAVAADGQGGTFHVEFDGVDKTGSTQVPDTGGWTIWQTVSRTVNLSAGQQVMRIFMESVNPANASTGNFDYVRLTAGTTGALIGHWSLDDGGGTVAADTQGNHAALQGATWTTGQSGSALAFDGVSDYAEIAHRASYLLDEGTVVFWLNSANLVGTYGLFSKDANGFGSGGHLNLLAQDGALVARLQSAAQTFVISAGGLQANRWHHAGLTFGPAGLRLYLDGQLAASNAYTGGLGPSSGGTGNQEPIALGASTGFSAAGSVTPLSNFFAGALDEVRIYSRALSAAEIAALAGP